MSVGLYFFMLFFSIIIFPWWMFRRMKRVKEVMTNYTPRSTTLRTEESVESDGDGLFYGKAHHADDDLMAADKAATAMPDIVKTLEGRR